MIEDAWATEYSEVLKAAGVDPAHGLDAEQVRARRKRFGRNALRHIKSRNALTILAAQFKSSIIALLGAAAILAGAFGDPLDTVAIAVVILITVTIGFVTELRAVRSMEALRRLGKIGARVRRGGELIDVSADALLPGDIVVLSGGDVVAADIRLIQTSKLQADESTLTGESVPVGKHTSPLKPDTPLAERANMLWKGTSITRGTGEGVVAATGMHTQLGRISSLVAEAEEETTPIERRLNRLSQSLVRLTLFLVGFVAVVGLARRLPLQGTLETAIALAVASIPEGLPIVATIALATGMRRMARRHALVNRLSSVETLGATTVILTDKTGTLTENRMDVQRLVVAEGVVDFPAMIDGTTPDREQGPGEDTAIRRLLEIGTLCNNASLSPDDDTGTGDPLEIALLAAARAAGINRADLIDQWPEVREVAFDSDSKMMATYHRRDAGYWIAVKGAYEMVIAAATSELVDGRQASLDKSKRDAWLASGDELSGRGFKVLSIAERTVNDEDATPYEDLILVGMVALLDPPREGVGDVLATAHAAGIRTVMVTGDRSLTAENIARAVGLAGKNEVRISDGGRIGPVDALTDVDRAKLQEISVFARATPRQKLDLVSLYQQAGEVVGMIGDGVNDAPALQKADIGIAMGKRGTQVAKEAADIVLMDDRLGTVITAIGLGRVIFDNIRTFVVYLVSCNISEIACVAIASILGAPAIRPMQILFLNLVTDVFPALALGVGPGSKGVMTRPPRRPGEPIVGVRQWWMIAGYALGITAAVIGALMLALQVLAFDRTEAASMSFLTLALAQLWHVINMRQHGTSLLINDITRNPWMWGAVGLCGVLTIAVAYVPWLAAAVHVVVPSADAWLMILGLSLVPVLIGQLVRAIARV